jgi:hypothetical protein
MGIDVDASEGGEVSSILADDFLCTTTGPITEIVVYGSWRDDYLPYEEDPAVVKFTLSLHKDIPVGDPCNPDNFSKPGKLIWSKSFEPGSFQVEIEASEISEGWMYTWGQYYFPADTICWKYTFPIEPNTLTQEGSEDAPVVYWLDVQAAAEDQVAEFGWKTTFLQEQWNDNAVYCNGTDPCTGRWFPLVYPSGHDYAGQPLDLAFEIKTESEPQEPYTLYAGWNEKSSQGSDMRWLAADDFYCCSTKPVTVIRWWGSFLGWGELEPPGLPDRFQVCIWDGVPAGDYHNFSHPGKIIWETYIKTYGVNFIGFEHNPCEDDPNLAGDSKYEFYAELDEYFQQPGDNGIYWISIMAIYDSGWTQYPWGWETRPHYFNDAAVNVTGLNPNQWPPYPGVQWANGNPITCQTTGCKWDLSFELISTKPPKPDPDFNDDCTVNFIDFAIFADKWLETY